MALSNIRTQIRTEIGGRTDLNSVIDDQINFAIDEISMLYEFDELWANKTTTTTSGQSAYLLPSDLYVLWSVKEETKLNMELEYKDIRQFDRMDESKTGIPHHYTQYNRQLILFNMVPDNNAGSNYSIRIRYWMKHPNLVQDADTMILPSEWERGVRLQASAFMFGILDMDDKAAAKNQELDRWMTRIRPVWGARKERAKFARVNPMISYRR